MEYSGGRYEPLPCSWKDMRMEIASVTDLALITELSNESPPPEEKWHQRDDFDPTYGAKELRSAKRKGWIELDDTGAPETWRFRLTPLARAVLRGDA